MLDSRRFESSITGDLINFAISFLNGLIGSPEYPTVSLLAIAVLIPSGYRAVAKRVDTHSGSVVECGPVIVTYNGLVIELLVPVKHIKASHRVHRYTSTPSVRISAPPLLPSTETTPPCVVIRMVALPSCKPLPSTLILRRGLCASIDMPPSDNKLSFTLRLALSSHGEHAYFSAIESLARQKKPFRMSSPMLMVAILPSLLSILMSPPCLVVYNVELPFAVFSQSLQSHDIGSYQTTHSIVPRCPV